MSLKLLTEPLASASPSKCPTPARMASGPSDGSQTRQASASPAMAASDNRPMKPAPAHTSERPNWALAPADRKGAAQFQSPGRSTVQPSATATHRGKRGGKRSKRGSNASKTPPATTPNPSTQSPVKKRRAQQPSPEKRPTMDKSPARGLRKEKAEPWINRVSSWVEQTSSTIQTSPSGQGTPAASSGTSSSVPATTAKEAMGDAKTITTSHTSATTSPLNPHAPVWEYKPRQPAALTGQTQVQTSTPDAPSPLESPEIRVSRNPLSHDLEADLQRLRAMLRDSGLAQGRSQSGSPGQQQRSIWGPPVDSQAARASAAIVRSGTVDANTGFQNALHLNLHASGNTVVTARQRTQTQIPLGQQVSSQGQGRLSPLEIPRIEQRFGMNGTPGLAYAQNVLPTVRYPPAPASSPAQLPRVSTDAALGVPSSVMNVPRLSYSTLPLLQLAPGPPKPISPPVQAPQGFTSVHVGRHPGSAPSTSPNQAPGSGRSRPPPGNSTATAPTVRFYGIETPRVVFDKHGWTVNHP
ncbi:hypothetical protein BV20DRAFT_18007 [Pilatotrama ljubarskyi]|nr:hypothetical protein BV20DRAFT_18007 [Pilatotrama ljubarskyi]